MTHDTILSQLVRGRSLAAIGHESGTSRQAVHSRLNTIARQRGLTRAGLMVAVETVLAAERCERAERLQPATEYRTDDGRRVRPDAGYRTQAELDSLADDFLAGRWSRAKQAAAERCERVLFTVMFTND